MEKAKLTPNYIITTKYNNNDIFITNENILTFDSLEKSDDYWLYWFSVDGYDNCKIGLLAGDFYRII